MNSSLFECSIEPQNIKKDKILYTIFNVLKYVFIVISCFFGLLALFLANTFWIFTIISVLITLCFLKLQYNYYTFYDYSIISNEIRFSKVINNKNRRFLFSTETSYIEKIGYYDKNLLNSLKKQNKIKRIYLVPKNFNGEKIYILVNKNSQKYFLIASNNNSFTSLLLKKVNTKIIDTQLYNKTFTK